MNIDKYEEKEDFTEKEKVVLRFADVVTLSRSPIDKSEFDKLKTFFNDREIIDLVAWISFQNMSSKFNSALDIPSQGFCRLK